MQTFVAGIPGAGGQWLELKLPPEPSIGPWVIAAVLSALGLLLCVRCWCGRCPSGAIWRRSRRRRSAWAKGDLQARARLSRHSSIGNLGETFNQMSERIGALISNQRELTNAVSHEAAHAHRAPVVRAGHDGPRTGRGRARA